MTRSTFGLITHLLALMLSAGVLAAIADQQAEPDPWEAVRLFLGEWSGTAEGEAGRGTVRRSYKFVMNGRFLLERNISTYPPQEKNPKGEIHEHWSLFSYDRARRALVMRQFHVEGFVSQYVSATSPAAKGQLVFESESLENMPAGWRARESYTFLSPEEFTETFELALPGQAFKLYSRSSFQRVKVKPD